VKDERTDVRDRIGIFHLTPSARMPQNTELNNYAFVRFSGNIARGSNEKIATKIKCPIFMEHF